MRAAFKVMIELKIKYVTSQGGQDGMSRLEEMCHAIGKSLPINLSAILNKTATKVKTQRQPMGIKQEMQGLYASGFKARDITRLLKQKKSNKTTLRAEVILDRRNRPSLTLFKHKITKNAGVTYKMLKNKQGHIPSGFGVRGIITKRRTKKAYPLVFPKGVSPAALFHGQNLYPKTLRNAKIELEKQAEERIKMLMGKEAKKYGVAK